MGTLLPHAYEVRGEQECFDEIQDVKVTKDLLNLARHIVNHKAGDFGPERFRNHYETDVIELISQSRPGSRSRRRTSLRRRTWST